MPRRSSAKGQVIIAARHPFRGRGYLDTSVADVLSESGAPRGSAYFHLPGGKGELATEVAVAHTTELVELITTLSARLANKGLPHEGARELAALAVAFAGKGGAEGGGGIP